uniref:Uncharacterized protein n=1 Tax=Siphoviridae sp. ctkV91 TaxID=2827924 RepID=A0A8S5TDT9_9CAUD|nr:MAG TPA: hypothetical protein [Siphoviridae sp. ctkV91]
MSPSSSLSTAHTEAIDRTQPGCENSSALTPVTQR